MGCESGEVGVGEGVVEVDCFGYDVGYFEGKDVDCLFGERRRRGFFFGGGFEEEGVFEVCVYFY